MASTFADDKALVELLAESVETDLSAADRLTGLLSRSVPWQFPGRLLEVLTAHVASVSDAQLRHGVLAVEYSALHQYLHAIALADDALIEPASSSAYATDTVAAILDGDLLQARAFERLDAAVDDPEPAVDAYRRLSAGSVAAYERTATAAESSPDPAGPRPAGRVSRTPELAPLAGVSGTLTGHMLSLPASRIRSLERAAATLGRSTPIHAPTDWQPPARTRIDEALETIGTLVSASAAADVERLVGAERTVLERLCHGR